MNYRDVTVVDIVVFYKPTEERNGSTYFWFKRLITEYSRRRIHLRNGIRLPNGVPRDEPQAAKPTRTRTEIRTKAPPGPRGGVSDK